MGIFQRASGHVFHGIAVVLDAIFGGVIAILDTIVILTESLRRSLAQVLAAGGCLLLFLFLNPLGMLFLFRPEVLTFLFVIFVVPMLGRTFISLLKYGQYVVTEYFFDYADYLKSGKTRTFRRFGEYGARYIRKEQERMQREQEARRAAEQRMWEERFRQWYAQQAEAQRRYREQYQGQSGGYGPYGPFGPFGPGQRPGGAGSSRGGFTNPYDDFISKYERSAKILGVPTETDEYQVKLAYRKLAKQYHPDVNKAPDATKRFQEINDAYDFMSKDNIERYKQIRQRN